MSKKSVTDLNVESKKVIVRVDFNVPHKGDVITDDNRIRAALPTIQYLLDHNAKVILMSHLGKVDHKDPEKTEADKKKNNMAPVAGALQALLPDYKVKFVDATRGEALEQAVNELQDKEVLLIQNTRYEKGESKNDPDLGAYWASLGDLYVSDAFGSVHRAHASTVGIPTHLPSAAGFLIEKELKYLGKALDDPKRPFVAVLGGAKVSDKIGVIENLLDKADKVIVGGGMAYTFYKAMGYNVGTSLLEEDKVEVAAEFIKKGGDKLILPVDNVIANDFDNPTDIKVVPSCQIPDGYMGLDIGPETIKLFTEELAGAKTVFWNGPMGVFEKEEFAKGTIGVCEAIANLEDCMSIIGGGDSASAAKNLGYADKISHISTGGGASLEYMEGKILPGIAIIEEK
ncbi:MAG: phosphoglycerate kinase [Erysipelotrichaceae bacterium]|jgi:phosphoglycerate kinase|nr:phosphoglycerate kinase [Erysipelotrichaceae bacterium]MBR3167927.1 phosphoglycerate kinase [Erysipelotrichaceae bacterium]